MVQGEGDFVKSPFIIFVTNLICLNNRIIEGLEKIN